MKWTKTPPSREGWYWYNDLTTSTTIPVRFYYWEGVLGIDYQGDDSFSPILPPLDYIRWSDTPIITPDCDTCENSVCSNTKAGN